MKKNVFKTMVAAVCVVAAGMGGMKAYNAGNQSEANVLLAENVEALSAGDGTVSVGYLCVQSSTYVCYIGGGSIIRHNKNVW